MGVRLDDRRDIENLIIDDVEKTLCIAEGDFRSAISTMWLTVSHLMRYDELFDISVPRFGRFYTKWKNVEKNIRRELKKKLRDRSKLDALVKKRRWMIENGKASKTYYLRKKMFNGTEDERRAAKDALRILQNSLRRFSASRSKAGASKPGSRTGSSRR